MQKGFYYLKKEARKATVLLKDLTRKGNAISNVINIVDIDTLAFRS
jgi:hypothetical protein